MRRSSLLTKLNWAKFLALITRLRRLVQFSAAASLLRWAVKQFPIILWRFICTYLLIHHLIERYVIDKPSIRLIIIQRNLNLYFVLLLTHSYLLIKLVDSITSTIWYFWSTLLNHDTNSVFDAILPITYNSCQFLIKRVGRYRLKNRPIEIFVGLPLELSLRRKLYTYIYGHVCKREATSRYLNIHMSSFEDMIERRRRTTTFDLRKVCNLFHLCNLLPRWQKTAFKRTTMKTEQNTTCGTCASTLRMRSFHADL